MYVKPKLFLLFQSKEVIFLASVFCQGGFPSLPTQETQQEMRGNLLKVKSISTLVNCQKVQLFQLEDFLHRSCSDKNSIYQISHHLSPGRIERLTLPSKETNANKNLTKGYNPSLAKYKHFSLHNFKDGKKNPSLPVFQVHCNRIRSF